MNIPKAWTEIVQRGCHLFDSEEDIKLRKIQNTMIVVLIIAFGWAIFFELLLGLHLYLYRHVDTPVLFRMFAYYVLPTAACLGAIIMCLLLQKTMRGPICALATFFIGLAWNFFICVSISYESMFFLIKMVYMPVPLIALSGRKRSQKAIIIFSTMAVIIVLAAEIIFHYHHEPLFPLPGIYTPYLLTFVLYAVTAAIIIIFYYVAKITDDAEDNLFREQERSERLLLNILPATVAGELKETGSAKPVKFDQVTILIIDIAGFTRLADSMDPESLVRELDNCFSSFDLMTEKYRLEKLKTIGDAYLCAGGVPVVNTTNAIDAVLAALEIRNLMALTRKTVKRGTRHSWGIRTGIATGPVIAGVIGEKKFTYDVWGDTVTAAGILETHCKVGEINISKQTHDHVKALFNCRHRGKVEIGPNRNMDMYFVKSIRKEYSLNPEGTIPNHSFMAAYDSIKQRKTILLETTSVCRDRER